MIIKQLNGRAIKSNRVYRFVRIEVDGKQKFAKIFNKKALQESGIQTSVLLTSDILTKCQEMVYPQHFLPTTMVTISENQFLIFTDPYQYTLEDYIKKNIIGQQQMKSILMQIIKCVFSIYQCDAWHRNLRPQHFVKCKNSNFWKLASFVFDKGNQQTLKCQFSWNNAYQPPQAYINSQFSSGQLDQMIVWNVGSIIVDMLLGRHKLNSLDEINNFINSQFTFESLGIKKQFSSNLCKILGKMLHYQPQKRLKFCELLTNDFLCQQVAVKAKQLNYQINSSQSTGRGRLHVVPEQRHSQISRFNQQIQTIDQSFSTIDIFKKIIASNLTLPSQNTLQSTRTYLCPSNIYICGLNYNQNEREITNQIQNDQIISSYKNCYDQFLFFQIIIKKINNVEEFTQQQKIPAMIAVNFISLLKFNMYTQALLKKQNTFQIQVTNWIKFLDSDQYKGLSLTFNNKYSQVNQTYQKMKSKFVFINNNNNQLFKLAEIFIQKDISQTQFLQIKQRYRRIIMFLYNKISKLYNKTLEEKFARLSMYLTFAFGFQKITKKQNIKTCFQLFFNEAQIDFTILIPYNKFYNYIQEENGKKLAKHSLLIIQRFFQIKK